ncbi:hypothetical protein EVA_08271 [gut metagenome]|uniref:Uncharacterized protein n=1 Tax=gut metagenome TaxID=749906 RepID=J9G8S8_9ZZZZ
MPINRFKTDIVIGIDPDVDKSGFAVLKKDIPILLDIKTLTFPDLLDELQRQKEFAQANARNMVVLVEAGWLNKANWHLYTSDTKQSAAAKGNAAGRNHEVGRKIIEMCEHYGINVEEIKPLPKVWKGKDRKITHEELASFTGYTKRTNQEGRDAALIAWEWAGLPIRINTSSTSNRRKHRENAK